MKLEFEKESCCRCNGSGSIVNPTYTNNDNLPKHLRRPQFIICQKCCGRKKLTWIEQVFGIKLE